MCTRPMKGFKLGINPENGKNILKIMPYHIDHIHYDGTRWVGVSYENRTSKLSFNPKYPDANIEPVCLKSSSDIYDFIEIPCGKCPDCLLQRSRDWANRCMLELQYHESSAFLTLTYDDEHLPKTEVVDPVTGELIEHATLVKSDMSKFMKALRQEYGYNNSNYLRFFGCGEYGSETKRPHLHIIVFGLKFPKDDLTLYKRNFRGDDLYNSKMIDKVWDKGHVVIGDVTWESCAYTARYILKKKFGKESVFYEDLGIQPEFINMSRRPGIGKQYYDDHPELFDTDFISIATGSGGRDIYPPKYFERLYEVDCPSESAARKEKRVALMEEKKAQILAKTDKSYLEYLADKEYNAIRNLNKLPRKEI